MSDFADEEGGFHSPEELFGKNVEFIMSRMYVDTPNWNFLFNYYSSLYGKYVYMDESLYCRIQLIVWGYNI